jgi:tRNA(Ile)-lysidine synthase
MDASSVVIKKVKKTIARYNMLKSGDRIVVSVSGGCDSVCLLHVLNSLKDIFEISLVVVHFNHGLRPDEDDDETRFVETLAKKYRLPFETASAADTIRNGQGGVEESARRARYRFLQDIKQKKSAQKIAVGHNKNDQAETVLMRLLRGSGTSGLSGIPPCRDDVIIRPLLEISRSEIETCLKQTGLEYVTDPSNLENEYLRNRIRHDLVPRLKQYQPRIVDILSQTSDLMRTDDDFLINQAGDWIQEHAEIRDNRRVKIPLGAFLELHRALRNRILRSAIETVAGNLRKISLRHIEAIERIANGNRPNAMTSLPNGLVAERNYDSFVIMSSNSSMEYKQLSWPVNGPGTFRFEALACEISFNEIERGLISKMGDSNFEGFLNADRLSFPLMVRTFREGDSFIPLGMVGHKKLKDLFIDLKIPSHKRKLIPVLTFNGIPVWIGGIRIDDRFKVTQDTKKVLKVNLVTI